MCYTLPGPRCSNHASQTLNKVKTALDNSKGELANLEFQKKSMSEAVKDYPDDKSIAKRYEEVNKKYEDASRKHQTLSEKYHEAQKSYDTTPAGQKELKTLIEQEKRSPLEQRDPQTIVSLLRRQRIGRSKRTWAILAYKRSQDEKKGNTIRKQRGNFITFKDRNTDNQEIVHEREAVPA